MGTNDNRTSTPKWLWFFRRRAGLTVEQLAAASGVSRVQLTRYEGGHREPTMATASKIADALDVSVDQLFPGGDRMGPMDVLDFWTGLNDAQVDRIVRRAGESPEAMTPEESKYADRIAAEDEADTPRKRRHYARRVAEETESLALDFGDGRVVREQVPAWFARLVSASSVAQTTPKPRARGAGRPKARRNTRAGSAGDDGGESDPPSSRGRRQASARSRRRS